MPRPPAPRQGRPLRTAANGFPGFIRGKRQPKVIAKDIWGCIWEVVEFRGQRIAKERIRQARSYLEQALDFYVTAENPQLASRPLLYYYSFLNLAKVFLLDRAVSFPPQVTHGIRDPRTNVRERLRFEGQRVSIEPRANDRSRVFPEFASQLGGLPARRSEFRIVDLLAQVPAIHRVYTQVVDRASRFVPVERFEPLTDGRRVWTRCIIGRRDRDVALALAAVGRRRAFRRIFRNVRADASAEVWFETTPDPGRRRGVDRALGRQASRIRELGVWSLLTDRGYRYYLGDFAPGERLPQLASIYAIMFYLGSITRYKPYDFDRIVEGRYGWLVSEFLATQPQQFLYLLASTMAGVDVVRPWAV
jgi:hypothetical protein